MARALSPRTRPLLAAPLLLLVGCATAGEGTEGQTADSVDAAVDPPGDPSDPDASVIIDQPDAAPPVPGTPDATPPVPGTPDAAPPDPGPPDASSPPPPPPPDAAPGPIETTVTHSMSTSITAANSISCNASNRHADNSYLRVFDMTAMDVATDFTVSKVTIGIETATAGLLGGGVQPATVRVHTLSGELALANLTEVGSANVSVSNTATGILLDVPLTAVVPAGSTMVAEFFTPDGQALGHSLFVGSNALGQTGPSYLVAPDCEATEPADLAGLEFPNMHVVMSVTGTHLPSVAIVD